MQVSWIGSLKVRKHPSAELMIFTEVGTKGVSQGKKSGRLSGGLCILLVARTGTLYVGQRELILICHGSLQTLDEWGNFWLRLALLAIKNPSEYEDDHSVPSEDRDTLSCADGCCLLLDRPLYLALACVCVRGVSIFHNEPPFPVCC